MTKKQLLIPVMIATITGASFLGIGSVSAHGIDAGENSSLVKKIADKFNLNESDVQAVFKEVRDERATQMKTDLENRLNQAVTDGKITDAQKTAILKKLDELHQKKEANAANWKNMTQDQRRAAMQSERQELQEWAKANNLDLNLLLELGLGMGKHNAKVGLSLK